VSPLFRRVETLETGATDGDIDVEVDERPSTGKGRATPKRSQARAARAADRKKKAARTRKEAKARRRETMRETRASLTSTDVSKLPANERVPELVYARDLVDSRFYIGQALIWLMVIVIVIGQLPALALVANMGGLIGLFVIIAATVRDSGRIQHQVNSRYPNTTARVKAYAFRRIVSPRRMRRPVPRLSRGAEVR